jgi:hypothetical protein
MLPTQLLALFPTLTLSHLVLTADMGLPQSLPYLVNLKLHIPSRPRTIKHPSSDRKLICPAIRVLGLFFGRPTPGDSGRRVVLEEFVNMTFDNVALLDLVEVHGASCRDAIAKGITREVKIYPDAVRLVTSLA